MPGKQLIHKINKFSSTEKIDAVLVFSSTVWNY